MIPAEAGENFLPEQRPAWTRLFWIFLTAALLGLALRIINIGNPLNDWDEATYALVTRSLMAGHWPYSVAFDHKPVGLYYVFACFFKAFGYNLTALRLMPFAAIGITTSLLFLWVRQHASRDFLPLGFATVLFMSTCASFGNGGLASNTEIIQMPLFAAWWLAAGSFQSSPLQRALVLGAISGAAAQINYLGGFVLALSTATALLWMNFKQPVAEHWRRFFMEGACAFLSFAAVGILLLVPLIIGGDIVQYFNLQRAYLGVYQGTLHLDKVIRALLSTSIPTAFFMGLWVCMISVAGPAQRVLRPMAPMVLPLLAGLAITIGAIALTNRLYPHYFNLLVVPSALLLVILLFNSNPQSLARYAWMATLLALLVLSRGAWDVYLKDWRSGFQQRQQYEGLAAMMRRHAGPNDKVFLLDINHTLYFMADVTPATRFVFGDHLFMDRFLSVIGSSTREEISSALDEKPALVVACYDRNASSHRAFVESRLQEGYTAIEPPAFSECRELKAYLARNKG